jgi:hypothetical protein
MVDIERFLNERPKILIIGQIKSGKSFLANLILRKKLLPTDEGPCTGRMVVLKSCHKQDGSSISEKPELRVLSDDGTLLEEMKLEIKQDGRPFIPSKYIRERGKAREQAAGEWVEITMNDPLLEYFEVIDSPGLDENSALDKLVNETVCKGLIHSLIYVIDGCEGLTTKDLESLEKIRMSVNNERILFVCTKVDKAYGDEEDDDPVPDPSDLQFSDSDETPEFEIVEEEEPEEKPSVQKTDDHERLQKRVFNSLRDAGFLTGYSDWDKCPYFHGLSAYRVEDARQTNTDNDPTNIFVNAYNRFEENLAKFFAESLNFHLKMALEHLKSRQVMLVEMISHMRFKLARKALNIKTRVEFAIEAEGRVYKQLKATVTTKLMSKLTTIIIEERDKALKNLPETAASISFSHWSAVKVEGKRDIVHAIQQCVADQLNEALIERVKDQLPILAIESTIELCISNLGDDMEAVRNIRSLLNAVYSPVATKLQDRQRQPSVKTIFSSKPLSSDSCDDGWKIGVAKKFLRSLVPKNLSREYCCTVEKVIDEAHNGFLKDLEKLRERAREMVEEKHAEKREVRVKEDYELAALVLETNSLLDSVTYTKPQRGIEIGKGPGSVVYACADSSWGPCTGAVIKVRQPWPPLQSKNIWPTCLYLSKELLPSDRIQSSVGFILPSVNPPLELWVIEDRMDCSLETVICGKAHLRSETWLQLAVDVADGIWSLHSQGIPHHNIKPSNILLDSSHRARLSDLGLLDLAVLRQGTLSRPVFFIAPELAVDDSTDYDLSSEADVFSFGILLWYLFSGRCLRPPVGTGLQDPLNYRIVFQYTSTSEFFLKEINGLRPDLKMWQNLGGVHKQAAELMESCWAHLPSNRPCSGELKTKCEKLQQDIKADSTMK